MRLVAGLHPNPLGSYSAPPDPLDAVRGREREEETKKEGMREGRSTGRVGKGEEKKEKGNVRGIASTY